MILCISMENDVDSTDIFFNISDYSFIPSIFYIMSVCDINKLMYQLHY